MIFILFYIILEYLGNKFVKKYFINIILEKCLVKSLLKGLGIVFKKDLIFFIFKVVNFLKGFVI